MVDYSPKTAFKQNRRLCFMLLDQIEHLLSWKGEPNFRDVGDLVEARNCLEHASYYLGTLGESKGGSKRVNRIYRDLAAPDVADSPRPIDNARKERRRLRKRRNKT
jgi:hypothetical protein